MSDIPATGLALRSRIDGDGTLTLWFEEAPPPTPGAGEVLVRIEAAPINPSDMSLLTRPAEPDSIEATERNGHPALRARVAAAAMPAMAARIDRDMPVGNESAGTVVAAGPDQQALIGRRVAGFGGGMYAQYRLLKAADCMVHADGVTAEQAASSFVNPLTALCMVETMRRDGHRALVLTAAAAHLGRMLNKVCQEDGVEIVNIVRKPAQVEALRALGARHVCNSSDADFTERLTEALAATGATIAFDAIGGGPLAGQILTCMEAVARRDMTTWSPYGSTTHKQVYVFGGLDPRPTEIDRKVGMAWGVAGWLMPWVLQSLGADRVRALRERVAAGITDTFASSYAERIALTDLLRPDTLRAFSRHGTGGKFLVLPQG